MAPFYVSAPCTPAETMRRPLRHVDSVVSLLGLQPATCTRLCGSRGAFGAQLATGYGAAASLHPTRSLNLRLVFPPCRHGIVPARQSSPSQWRPAGAVAKVNGSSPAKLSAGWEPPGGWSLTNLNSLTSSQRLGPQPPHSARSADINSLTSSLTSKSMGSMGARRPPLVRGSLSGRSEGCSYYRPTLAFAPITPPHTTPVLTFPLLLTSTPFPPHPNPHPYCTAEAAAATVRLAMQIATEARCVAELEQQKYEQKRLIKEQRLAKEQRRGDGAHMHVHADADVQPPGARPPGKKQRPSRSGSGRGGETLATTATPATPLATLPALPTLAAPAPPPTATPRGCCSLSPLRASNGAPPPRAKPSWKPSTGVRHPPAGSTRQLRTSSSELLALNTGSFAGANPAAITPAASTPPLPTLQGLRTSASMPALRL